MSSPIDIIHERIDKLLVKSSEKELNSRKLGRSKKGVALDELRAGLAGILEYLDELSGEVKDHTLDKDTVSRLANQSWGADQLKKQQASLKRTATELGKATEVIDKLIGVVSDQYTENQFTHNDLQNGVVSEGDYYAQKNPTWGLRARRDDLNKSYKIVCELKDAIAWAKDIKKHDEARERTRRDGIRLKLRTEISKQVNDLAILELVLAMSAVDRLYFSPKDAYLNLEKYASKTHIAYLTNKRNDFIDVLLDEMDYEFTARPGRVGLVQPSPVDSEHVALHINRLCQGTDYIKQQAAYKEYIELYKSEKSVQAIKSALKIEPE